MAALAALTTGILLLAGCGKPADSSANNAKPSEAATPAPQAQTAGGGGDKEDPVLNLFCWTEYVPQSVIDAFTAKTGIKVNVQNYESNEEMLQKLLSGGGNFDLIQPSDYMIEAMGKAGYLRPVDKAAIPNLKNIAPEFLDKAFDPGNQYSVPWMAGTVGIMVNTELVTDEIKGYKDVFQEKFKGKIITLDDARELVSWSLASQGIDMNAINPENLQKAREVLKNWIPLIAAYDSTSPKDALLKGNVAIGVIWNGEGGYILRDDTSGKFKWILPEEGTHLFIDSLAIPKSAKHPKNAELFMNFILQPEINKMVWEEFPYLNPNAEGRKLLSPEQLANAAAFPPDDVVAKMPIFQDIGDQASAVDEMINELKIQ
jgi:spermidine/putrescine transport system substrate-binding protein